MQGLGGEAQCGGDLMLDLARLFPPLMRLSGHRPNQLQKCRALGKTERFEPNSAKIVCTVADSSPGTAVRSTPRMRYISVRRSKRNWLRLGFFRRMEAGRGCISGSTWEAKPERSC